MTAAGMNIAELAVMLDGSSFIQCHQSYIVNILHMRKIQDKDFVLKSGELVPIGRKYQTDAQRAYRECFEKLIMGEMV
jgi:DNA-binding LytR/AlgR family response regulator